MDVHKTEARTVQVVIDTLCDLCGLSVDDQSRWPGFPEVNDLNEITLRHYEEKHDGYESLATKELTVDCCPACWAEKVLPFLRSVGLKRDYQER